MLISFHKIKLDVRHTKRSTWKKGKAKKLKSPLVTTKTVIQNADAYDWGELYMLIQAVFSQMHGTCGDDTEQVTLTCKVDASG